MFLYGTNITSDHVTGVKVQMSQGIALVKPTSCHIFSFIAGELSNINKIWDQDAPYCIFPIIIHWSL